MAYNDMSTFPRGIFYSNMNTSPLEVFATGQQLKIAGVVVGNAHATVDDLVTFRKQDGTSNLLVINVPAEGTVTVDAGFLTDDGLEVVSVGGSTTKVTVFYESP